MKTSFAFDKTARVIDVDGRLHVERSHISRATVNPYYGKEIPGYEELGLDPDRVYQLLRDPAELKKGASTFARLPILKEHVPVTVDAPRQDLIVGSIGSDVEFKHPYLDADICVWDAEAIAGIESGKIKELSCAYRYVPVMTHGEFEGQAYDGVMTEIQGNHLALVEVGRAGPDVVVADSNPFKDIKNMHMTKLGKALFVALSAALPKLAADAALQEIVGKAKRKGFDKKAVQNRLIALDAEIDSQKIGNIIDALLDVEDDPKPLETDLGADESPAEKLRALLAGKVEDEIIEAALALIVPAAEDEEPEGKPAEDEEETPHMRPETVKAAMDKGMREVEAKLRKEFKDAAEAARDVRAVVGDVAMDSASDIYSFALDHLNVDRKDVTGLAALRALFRVAASNNHASSNVIAQDSANSAASLAKKFPGLNRFKQG